MQSSAATVELTEGSVGRGTEALLESTWSAPTWLPVFLLLLGVLLAIGLYLTERGSLSRRKRLLLALLRWLAFALIIGMLPGWTISRHRTELPDLVLAIDVSASMVLEDHYPDEFRERLLTRVQAALAKSSDQTLEAEADRVTRFALAQTILTEKQAAFVEELKGRYHLRWFQIGNAARSVEAADSAMVRDWRPEDENSRLGKGLRDILAAQRGRPTAAIVLLTDGVTTQGPSLVEASQDLRRKGIPLFVVGLGTQEPQRDLRLTDLLVNEAVFVNDLVHFDARVEATGYTGDVAVRLINADTDQTLAETRLTLEAGAGQVPVRLAWRPADKGDYSIRTEVDVVAGEVNDENNHLTRKIRVSEAKLKVLLVQSGPSFEFRFLKTMLERELNRDDDASNEDRGFHSVLQEADQEYVATDKSALRLFPATREELFTYDVLIFGDVNPEFLSRSALEDIVEFVSTRGGGLIIASGPRFTPLAYRDTPLEPLFPISLKTAFIPEDATQAFRPQVTPLGASSPGLQLADSSAENLRIWQEKLNPLYWYLAAPDVRPGVRVLVEHSQRKGDQAQPLPIICQQFVGAGRVIFHATDETHRWRFRGGEEYFARYWVQTIRSLARAKLDAGQGVELTTDKSEYRRGDSVQLRVRFVDERLSPPHDDGVAVVVERRGMPRKNIGLRRTEVRNVFEGSVMNLPDGEYRVWLAAPTVPGPLVDKRFTMTAPPGELARLEADISVMREAAKLSGGRFYSVTEASHLPADLPPGRQVRIDTLPPETVWNRPIFAALFVFAVSAEWLLRKRWGLV